MLELIGRRIRQDGTLLDTDAFLEGMAAVYGMTLEEVIEGRQWSVNSARREIVLELAKEGLRQCDIARLLRMNAQAVNNLVIRDRANGGKP